MILFSIGLTLHKQNYHDRAPAAAIVTRFRIIE